ncbi:MAG: RHS repeat-associated core domain-containing protein, partial [Acidobacteriota bacterium]
YGESRSSSPGDDRENFATYSRDSLSGLDYADQRYYAPSLGRFLTPDPYLASSGGIQNPSRPSSWNKYPYVEGDPVNFMDRPGLFSQGAEQEDQGICQFMPEHHTCNPLPLNRINMPQLPYTRPPSQEEMLKARTITTGKYKDKAVGAVQGLSQNCKSLFSSIDPNPHPTEPAYSLLNRIDVAAMTSFFYEMGGIESNLSFSSATGYSINPDVAVRNLFVAGSEATTLEYAPSNGSRAPINHILIGTSFSQLDSSMQAAILVHELLHVALRTSDHSTILNLFGLSPAQKDILAAFGDPLTAFLHRGCNK